MTNTISTRGQTNQIAQISEKLYNDFLLPLARTKFSGNKYLWRRVNIFSAEDLCQEFIAYDPRCADEKDDRLRTEDFKQFIIQQIRKAKGRDRRNREYTFTYKTKPNTIDIGLNPAQMTGDDKLNALLFRKGTPEEPEPEQVEDITDPRFMPLIALWLSTMPKEGRQTLQYRAQGFTQEQIAVKLHINQSTVSRHLNHIAIKTLPKILKKFANSCII